MDDAPDVAGTWASRAVILGGEPLSPTESLAVARHAADGFAWGDGGSGAAQLALAARGAGGRRRVTVRVALPVAVTVLTEGRGARR